MPATAESHVSKRPRHRGRGVMRSLRQREPWTRRLSASLTALALPKCAQMSSSTSTILPRLRSAWCPRPARRLNRGSESSGMSPSDSGPVSPDSVAFFVDSSLMGRRASGADDANPGAGLRRNDVEDTIPRAGCQRNQPVRITWHPRNRRPSGSSSRRRLPRTSRRGWRHWRGPCQNPIRNHRVRRLARWCTVFGPALEIEVACAAEDWGPICFAPRHKRSEGFRSGAPPG
jgi:hypothetical protein